MGLRMARFLTAQGIHQEHLDMGGRSWGREGKSRMAMKSFTDSTERRSWDGDTLETRPGPHT